MPPPAQTAATLDRGDPGASLARELRRRKSNRERRTRERHPHLGGLILALNDPPQHEAAFQRGYLGEKTVAESLKRRTDENGVVLLHNRRMPAGRGDIDHIAIAPSGIYVIDAKALTGKIRIHTPWFGPHKLLISGRDRTALLDGLDRQVAAVHRTLEQADEPAVPLQGALCFTEADLPWLRTQRMRGHLLIYLRALAKLINSDGPLDTPRSTASPTRSPQRFHEPEPRRITPLAVTLARLRLDHDRLSPPVSRGTSDPRISAGGSHGSCHAGVISVPARAR